MVELMSEQKFDEYVLREFKLTNTKVNLIWALKMSRITNHNITIEDGKYVGKSIPGQILIECLYVVCITHNPTLECYPFTIQ